METFIIDWKPDTVEIIADAIIGSGVGVIPTDTVYGMVTSVHNPKAIDRLYHIRKRDIGKACIVLVPTIRSLEEWGVYFSPRQKRILDACWPGPLSVVASVGSMAPDFLLRGGTTLAFRVPACQIVRSLLARTGPLLAPSANEQGKTPSLHIGQAIETFQDSVDVYADGGECFLNVSTLIQFSGDDILVLRQGVVSNEYLKQVDSTFSLPGESFRVVSS